MGKLSSAVTYLYTFVNQHVNSTFFSHEIIFLFQAITDNDSQHSIVIEWVFIGQLRATIDLG